MGKWSISCLLVMALSRAISATTVHVPSQQPTIQAGIDAANPYDTVLVGPGTAFEHLEITKPLTLMSELGADSTIIDGQDLIQDTSNSVITVVGADSVTIMGFTIRGGRGMMTPDSNRCRGGGIFVKSATLFLKSDSVISNMIGFGSGDRKLVTGGGGVFVDSTAALLIEDCTFRQNSANSDDYMFGTQPRFNGGGAILSTGTKMHASRCTFVSNHSSSYWGTSGGALMATGDSVVLESCKFVSNGLQGGESICSGGGIAIDARSVLLTNTDVDSNTVYSYGLEGHGAVIHAITATILECNFIENGMWFFNQSWGIGGGLSIHADSVLVQKCQFIKNQIWTMGSSGSAIGGGASVEVQQGDFSNNLLENNLCSAIGGGHSGSSAVAIGGGASIRGSVVAKENSIVHNTCYSQESAAQFGSAICTGGGIDASYGAMLANNLVLFDSLVAFSGSNNLLLRGAGINVDSSCEISSSDSWSNFPDDVYGGGWQPNVNGNISVDPQFCYQDTGNYYLKANSPCAAGNHVSGQTVGAFDVDCYGAEMVKSVGIANGSSLQNVTTINPEFGWRAYYHPSYTQAKFEIAVGTDNDWQYSEMWNPAPFNSSDTFVTYAGAPLVDGQTYYLRLRISDGVSWSNWYNTSFHMNTPPAVPVPYAPAYPNITVSTTPDLSVANSTDVENDTLHYEFEVYRDSMLTLLAVASPSVLGMHNPESTIWTVTPPLDDNRSYYWHARAFDGYEYSAWSSMRFFIANNFNEPPNSFTLIDPPDSAGPILYNRKPIFRWTYTGDPDPYNQVRYRLELGTDPAFFAKHVEDSLYTSFWIPPDSLPYHSHYWWRVSAIDQHGATTSSTNTKEFWTWTLGDVDHSNNVDISDLTRMIDYLYISFGPILPPKVGDLDGDCTVDIADLSRLIDYLYISLDLLKIGGCGS